MKIGQPSFTSGEVDPSLHARADLPLYKTGLDTCLNYIVMVQGGARNRMGLAYKGETKNSYKSRIIPFAYNDDDSYLLEFNAKTGVNSGMRVYRNGELVRLSSTPAAWVTGTSYVKGDYVQHGGYNYYAFHDNTASSTNEPGVGVDWETVWRQLEDDIVEIPTPYGEVTMFEMDYAQNADTMVFTHPNNPPKQLVRVDHDLWLLSSVTFTPDQVAPTGLSGSGGTGTTYTYGVTAVNADTFEESLLSTTTTMAEDGGTLTWTDAAGASKYNIYKKEQGIFGFIGQSSDGTTGFKDTKLIAETDDTPPESAAPFASTSQYPTCVTFHEQRLCFGGANPQRINTSQTGNMFNFSVSNPAKDADALTLDVVANEVATIRYLISQLDMLVFTAGAELRISSSDQAFTLSNLSRKMQSTYGVQSGLKPLIIGDKILFVQRGGDTIRDFAYSLESDKFTGSNKTVTAKHLFDNKTIVSWAYSNEPYPVIWMVMSDGSLNGMTISEENEVLAFHQHATTNGSFEDVAVVPEGDTDGVYFVVNRTINGATKRYVEKFSDWNFDTIQDATFLDSHKTGTITGSTISGLDHLEGETVSVLIDGDVVSDLVVTSGSVTLPRTYTAATACVGLAYTSRLKTLEPPLPDAYGNEMSVARVQVRVLNTRGLWAGPDVDDMTEYPTRDLEDWGDPPQPVTDTLEIVIEPTWEAKGAVVIEQRDPLPSFILATVPDVEVGG